MKKYLIVSVLMAAVMSVSSSYAEDGMGNMSMMGDRFNMGMEKAQGMAMKMQQENGAGKKREYMDKHMESLKDMMAIMSNMMSAEQQQATQMQQMVNCTGNQGKGMPMGNRATMNKGQGQAPGKGNMMMGGVVQMMGGMMDQNQMMTKQMAMMQGMMAQMLQHMEQLEKQ